MVDTTAKPPPGLSKAAARWFTSCVKEFRFRTAGELQVLQEAARALTRAEQCAAILRKDGLVTNGARGLVSHPMLRAESQARSQFLAASRLLGIARPVVGDRSDA